jgi:hypothetical protein
VRPTPCCIGATTTKIFSGVFAVDLSKLSLHSLYWFLRQVRPYQTAKRRQLYRWIAKEKKRLHEAGVDPELVRLLCRHLANTRNQHAEAAYLRYKAQGRLFDLGFKRVDDFT